MMRQWIVMASVLVGSFAVLAEDGYDLWLRYVPVQDTGRLESYRQKLGRVTVLGEGQTIEVIRRELADGLSGLLDKAITIESEMKAVNGLVAGTAETLSAAGITFDASMPFSQEGYRIGAGLFKKQSVLVITASGPEGLLYGTFAFLRRMQTEQSIDNLDILDSPKIDCRVINHWDDLDGTTERVYSEDPRSIWWNYDADDPERRWRDYGRACASVGLNMVILNNVNSHVEVLTRPRLEHVKAIADTLRPYGIRVGLSANVASCLSPEHEFRRGPGIGTLDTLDPLDAGVIVWWREKIAEIYSLIPDFAGFLIKAGSEGMPGPESYGRSAASAANMYGDLLRPHGGIVMWRTFTYDVDEPDQTKRQYIRFAPQDGQYNLGNVFLQNKFGSRDFMSREPFHPLFGCMGRTQMSLELQITQEYTGHDKYLMFWTPLWKEILESETYAAGELSTATGEGAPVACVLDGSFYGFPASQIAGVANVSRVRNWTGHHFAQANWYAFGRLAWDHELSVRQIAEEWVRQTWGNEPEVAGQLTDMLISSHETMTSYVGPLGIAHTNTIDWTHYEPEPSSKDYWQRQFINATEDGIGTDRTQTGTNATGQYQPAVARQFENPATCPEGLILWFHRYGWQDTLPGGKTVWQALVDRYNSGVEQVEAYIEIWKGLKGQVDAERYEHVLNRLETQHQHAQKYRRLWLMYFHELNGLPLPEDLKR